MSIIDKLLIKVSCTRVGADNFANEYYESKTKNSFGESRRYVIYQKEAEPSGVPPLWHAWLHHLTNEIPQILESVYPWQKEHSCNLTGSKLAYRPTILGRHRASVSADYKKWLIEK
jgi:NADH:ubiquinone oxidoreductase subunit